MTSNIFAVMKKELLRFFGDKRMVIATILLPGILIYAMYSFMGEAISEMDSTDDDYFPQVRAVNLPESVGGVMEDTDLIIKEIPLSEVEENKQLVASEELDLIALFPENFDEQVEAYDSMLGGEAPDVEIYYNSLKNESMLAYNAFSSVLDNYESKLANRFDINDGEDTYNLATEKGTAGSVLSTMLPMLLMIFLFSGCMSVAPEAIAGEKERGTIATLLVTPTKRSNIAIGKIAALAIIALLSGMSSTVGTLLSLPKLMGMAEEGISANYYAISDYVMLAGVILSTVLVLITLISLISAYAKTIKEAQTTVMPLMIVIMLVGVSAQFGDASKSEAFWYLIPMYNSVQCMKGIFGFDVISANVSITIISNIIYSGIGVFLLTKMFNNEKIMFRK